MKKLVAPKAQHCNQILKGTACSAKGSCTLFYIAETREQNSEQFAGQETQEETCRSSKFRNFHFHRALWKTVIFHVTTEKREVFTGNLLLWWLTRCTLKLMECLGSIRTQELGSSSRGALALPGAGVEAISQPCPRIHS
ncbi:unnamed protein product [Eretmochelys imbricata]